jgi:hypothetical protein
MVIRVQYFWSGNHLPSDISSVVCDLVYPYLSSRLSSEKYLHVT